MYKQAPNSDGAIRLSDMWFLPEGSEAYAEVTDWLAAGNTLQPADPKPAPSVVNMRQARLALLQSGLLAIVNTAIAGMAGVEGDAARIEWEFASTVERSSPLVQSLAVQLSLTEAQLDNMFTLAATL